MLRDAIAPAWMAEPLSLEESAEKYIPPHLQQTFIDLCRQPVSHYIDRWACVRVCWC